jgi:hypothetical protein
MKKGKNASRACPPKFFERPEILASISQRHDMIGHQEKHFYCVSHETCS